MGISSGYFAWPCLIARLGTTVHIRSEVTQAGRTMAMIRGAMTSTDGKTVYCTCEHHKVAVPTRKEHLTGEFEVEWDRIWSEEEKMEKTKGKL